MLYAKPLTILAMLGIALIWAGAAHAERSDVCMRLETRLADDDAQRQESYDRLSRYDRALAERTQALHAAIAERNQIGCRQRGFFFRQAAQPELCATLAADIGRLEAEITRLEAERARAQPRRAETRDHARQEILAALARNRCGPQYARHTTAPDFSGRSGNSFRDFFDERARQPSGYERDHGDYNRGQTYRTLCVRQCDGYYWPISFSTVSARFSQDAEICRSSCPGASVELYVHRNPEEDIGDAVSLSGAPYSAAPNAFRHRREYDAACNCGQRSVLATRVRSVLRRNDGDVWSPSEPAPERSERRPAMASVPLPRPHPGRDTSEGGSDSQQIKAESDHYVTRDGRRIRVVGPEFNYRRPGGG